MKTMTNVIYPAIVVFATACFVLSQMARAVNPPPDGGYPGGNTAEGQNALIRLTSGTFNTAVGFVSLTNDTAGQFNTPSALAHSLPTWVTQVQAMASKTQPLARERF